jgi:hypothetical protein
MALYTGTGTGTQFILSTVTGTNMSTNTDILYYRYILITGVGIFYRCITGADLFLLMLYPATIMGSKSFLKPAFFHRF